MRFRNSLLVWVIAGATAISLSPASSHAAVLLSELCDPLNNYPSDRFIEIYNSGPDTVSLTNWALVAVGNNVDIQTWTLSGSILPGQALVAGNNTTVAVFTVNFPNASWSAGNATWNGRVGDGAKLIDSGGGVIDRVVVTGSGGSTFENANYVRNPNIYSPNPTYTASEWTTTPRTLATDGSPGTHVTAPRPPGPILAQMVTDPAFPLAGSPTHVQADVTDTTAAVTSVSLAWGTAPASLTNTIAMPLVSGTTYRTTAAIPAQVAGVTVYYKITATDASSGITTSELKSYALFFNLTVAQIQGGVGSSPYNGNSVITNGVVTARFGTFFAVQDGSGPWSGVWVRSTDTPTVGDQVTVRGTVSEADAQGYAGNTLLTNGLVTSSAAGVLPAAAVVPSGSALSEGYEGVLVKLASAVCTNPSAGVGQWQVNDGSGTALMDALGYTFGPILGTTYDVTGPVTFYGGSFKLEPRSAADIVFVADLAAPSVLAIGEMSDSTFLVQFTEPVDEATSEVASRYTIGALTGTVAIRDPIHPEHVLVTIANVAPGTRTLSATGVEDAFGNATAAANASFTYIDTRIPAGYYDGAIGLTGAPLRAALHEIIKNHSVQSYDYAYTAFQTTDVRPDGKLWDVYSDIPDGTPPYLYSFGQTGGGTFEGSGYNREHSFPQGWFGGSVTPMHTDLWILYPTDTKVNGYRGNLPYGTVEAASITSLNGSQVGPNTAPGYSGTVFEPIDAYKGDLARSTFYVSTRYLSEDGGWPGSPAASGANLNTWAAELYTSWSIGDPVSQKERLRNGAIYVIQGNRNPFVDHPEWAAQIFDPSQITGVPSATRASFTLYQNAPNPFNGVTRIAFQLAERQRVRLRVYDVSGRLIRTLVDRDAMEPGRHEVAWEGLSESASRVGEGLYFYRLEAGGRSETRRVVRVR
ncbi:MAG: T9SS type A sorting domain-containing protein [Candidatus Eisenbacteria bacterium]|uniref:T9SS type A sorting domain-containing protein n=1 Tax=Eiseniibacteriota bacterium TaxID=2212470 RepID=A0A849STL1_UNCEI|nr:T9SS type A sorting domain-containing protein [Candidatus Eisenbacteria bacterium]